MGREEAIVAMNREEIKALLPHREPMLLLDEVELDEEGAARGKYTVRGDEYFLQGHFPGNPIVPGVILCEPGPIGLRAVSGADQGGLAPIHRYQRGALPGDRAAGDCFETS